MSLIITGLEDKDLEREAMAMFSAAITFLYEHPLRCPVFAGRKSLTGIICPVNVDARQTEEAMLSALGGQGRPTTALQQCVTSHVAFWHDRFSAYLAADYEPEKAWQEAYKDLVNLDNSLKG